ncbi:MAG: hypothetical protein AB7R90_08355 [Reyranellaceae bacterium]
MRAAAILFFCLSAAAAGAQEPPRLEASNVLSWPRAGVDKFGCMLEREFGVRDPRFNCSLQNYVNRGNPCSAAEAYYEGPAFPPDRETKVMPQIERIEVAHEGGRVQSVTLIFGQRQTQTAIRALLGLPASPRAALPPNLASASIQGCRPDGATQICNVVLLQGFEHQGAGDVDCGEEGDRPEPTPLPGAEPPKT